MTKLKTAEVLPLDRGVENEIDAGAKALIEVRDLIWETIPETWADEARHQVRTVLAGVAAYRCFALSE